jgi:hypothetical protein
VKGKFILSARLTPLEVVVPVDPRSPRALWLGAARAPDVTVEVPAMTFPLPAVLGAARVRAQDVGPAAFAPRPGTLERALWLGATLSGVDTPAWALVTLTLHRPADLGTPTLAAFSPEQGRWETLDGACARVDAATVRCRTRTLGLLGLFGDAAPGETGDAWVDAEYALHREAFDADAAPRLAGLSLDALSAAARDVAARSPGRAGLSALFVAAAAAEHAGDRARADALRERALALVQLELDTSTDQGCGRLVALAHLIEYGRAAGLSRAARQSLEARRDELLWTCDAWTGWVRYDFVLPGALPSDGAAALSDADGTWSERHAVRFTIDLDSHVEGVTDADLRFPRVVYRDETDAAPRCGDDFRELSFTGAPETSRLAVAFDGSVAADTFTLGHARRTDEGAGTAQVRLRAQRWYEGADACLLVQDEDRTEPLPRYTTQLVDGFAGPSTPTLSQMLTDGGRGDNPLGVGAADVSGTARVTLPSPAGPWPFVEALVSWRFFPVTTDLE